MSISRQKFREIVLQLLCSYDFSQSEEEEMIPLIMDLLTVTRRTVREAYARMRQILEKQSEIDISIEEISRSYAIDRIQRVEKNILRMGMFELLYDKELPPKVAIAESMRLARKFSTPEAALFVNALVDSFYKKLQGVEVDVKDLTQYAEDLAQSQKIAEEAAHNEKQEDNEELDDLT